MHPRRYVGHAVLIGALCAILGACGSSSPSPASAASSATSASPASTAPASTAPASTAPASSPPPGTASSPAAASGAAAQKTIAANWTASFNPKEPAARRLALLQDGQQLASALAGMAKSSVAATTSARVTAVRIVSPTQAKVTYDILLSGKPVLTGQSGTAVLENGTWKVGLASFCGLLALQDGGTKSLPAACRTAT